MISSFKEVSLLVPIASQAAAQPVRLGLNITKRYLRHSLPSCFPDSDYLSQTALSELKSGAVVYDLSVTFLSLWG